MELGPLLNGHSLSVRKLRLYDRVFTHNWYPNVTRLCLTNSDRSKTPDSAWNLPILSSLSTTLEALWLSHEAAWAGGSGVILRSAQDQICLPHLRHIAAMGDEPYGAESSMAFLHSLSLPSFSSIMWMTGRRFTDHVLSKSLQFPPQEYCDHVRNIVISLVRADSSLMGGDTVFGSSTAITIRPCYIGCALVSRTSHQSLSHPRSCTVTRGWRLPISPVSSKTWYCTKVRMIRTPSFVPLCPNYTSTLASPNLTCSAWFGGEKSYRSLSKGTSLRNSYPTIQCNFTAVSWTGIMWYTSTMAIWPHRTPN